jgi:DNA-binding transcriptional LysR family regulator
VQADLKTFRLFVAVAESGSISGGAQRAHLALGAASKRIAELESRARVSLLKRHARGVSLTAAGHAFLNHARAVLLALDRLDAELGEYQRGIKGHVRLTANASAIAERLPADLGTFLSRHPELKIDLEERSSLDVVRSVGLGLADIGVFEADTPAHGLECFEYCSDRLVAVTRRGHPLSRRKRASPADVFAHDQVVLREGTSLFRAISQAAAQEGLDLRTRMRVHSFDAMCRMIEQGIGIGVLPESAIAPQLKAMRIAKVTIDAPWTQRRHLVGVRRLATLPMAAQTLVQHLTEV